jgi:hypothetical protein
MMAFKYRDNTGSAPQSHAIEEYARRSGGTIIEAADNGIFIQWQDADSLLYQREDGDIEWIGYNSYTSLEGRSVEAWIGAVEVFVERGVKKVYGFPVNDETDEWLKSLGFREPTKDESNKKTFTNARKFLIADMLENAQKYDIPVS